MLMALVSLFIGWLLGLIGLDTLLNNMVGLTQQNYYVVWFVMGLIIWLVNLIKK